MSLRMLSAQGLARFCFLFVLCYSAIFGLLLLTGDSYCTALRPLFALQTRLMAGEQSRVDMDCASSGRFSPALRYEVARPRTMPDGAVGLRGQKGAVQLLPLAQNAAVLGALILAWPGCSLRRRLLTFAAGLAALHLVFIVDAPMSFLADELPPDAFRERWLQWWAAFSAHGGRLLLLFAVYALALGVLLRGTAPQRGD